MLFAAFWRSKWETRVLDYQKLFPAARNFLSAPAPCTYLIPVLLESFLIIFNANQAAGTRRASEHHLPGRPPRAQPQPRAPPAAGRGRRNEGVKGRRLGNLMLRKPQECCTLPFPCSPRCGQPHRPRRGAQSRGRTRIFPQVRRRRRDGGGGSLTRRGSPDRRHLSSLVGAAGDAGQTAVVGALLARRLPVAAGR